jgi:hypothetical protein
MVQSIRVRQINHKSIITHPSSLIKPPTTWTLERSSFLVYRFALPSVVNLPLVDFSFLETPGRVEKAEPILGHWTLEIGH